MSDIQPNPTSLRGAVDLTSLVNRAMTSGQSAAGATPTPGAGVPAAGDEAVVKTFHERGVGKDNAVAPCRGVERALHCADPAVPLVMLQFPRERLHRNARHRDGNAMGYIVGREIYSHLEKVVDRLEDVANEISGIVIDHA